MPTEAWIMIAVAIVITIFCLYMSISGARQSRKDKKDWEKYKKAYDKESARRDAQNEKDVKLGNEEVIRSINKRRVSLGLPTLEEERIQKEKEAKAREEKRKREAKRKRKAWLNKLRQADANGKDVCWWCETINPDRCRVCYKCIEGCSTSSGGECPSCYDYYDDDDDYYD